MLSDQFALIKGVRLLEAAIVLGHHLGTQLAGKKINPASSSQPETQMSGSRVEKQMPNAGSPKVGPNLTHQIL